MRAAPNKKATSKSDAEGNKDIKISIKGGSEVRIQVGGDKKKRKAAPRHDSSPAASTTATLSSPSKSIAIPSSADEIIEISDEEDDQLKEAIRLSRTDSDKDKPAYHTEPQMKPEKNVDLPLKNEISKSANEDDSVKEEDVINALEALSHLLRSKLDAGDFKKLEEKLAKRRQGLKPAHLRERRLKEFIDVQRNAIREDSDSNKMWVYIHRVMDELRRYSQGQVQVQPTAAKRIKVENAPVEEATKNGVHQVPTTTKESSDNLALPVAGGSSVTQPPPSTSTSNSPTKKLKKPASQKHIKKLRNSLKECHQRIRELDETEVDFDDDDAQSSYELRDRYQRKYLAIYKKLAELEEFDPSLGRMSDKRFKFEGSRYPEVNLKISKFVNRRRARGEPCVPDFADVLHLYRSTNEEKRLGMSDALLHQEAKVPIQESQLGA